MGGSGKGKKASKKKFAEVPANSFENSFSKGFIPKDETASPEKPKKFENDSYWNQDSPKHNTTADTFVKHAINE